MSLTKEDIMKLERIQLAKAFRKVYMEALKRDFEKSTVLERLFEDMEIYNSNYVLQVYQEKCGDFDSSIEKLVL